MAGWRTPKAVTWAGTLLLALGSLAFQVFDPMEAKCEMGGVRCERHGDGWILENEDFKGDVTLTVLSGDYVILRDVHIRQAKAVRLEVFCDGCSVRGEDFTIEGRDEASIGLTGATSWRETPTPDVSLYGLEAHGIRSFHVSMLSGNVTLGNLDLACPLEDSFFSVRAPAGIVAVRLSDVVVDGCNGFSYSDDRDRDHDNAGLEPVPVELLRVHLTGLGPFYTGHNQGVSGPAASASALTVVDSTISDFETAIDVQEGGSAFVRNTTLSHSQHGITVSERGEVVVERSTFSDNRYGIRVWGDSSVQVTDSTFFRNGRVPFSGPGDCGGAITGLFTGFVHGSLFQGNTMAVEGPLTLFDASGNYWGSPSGPVIRPIHSSPEVCLPTAPAGDQVDIGVNFLPYLTSPP